MALIAFVIEKTREVNLAMASELLEVAARMRIPAGFKASLVAYGNRALPLVDPTEDWSLIPRAYNELPLLGKSPNLTEALKETVELIGSIGDPREPVQVVIVWSASVRPGREPDLIIEALEATGVKVDVVITRPSPPGWIKYNPVIAGKILTVRSNTNIERLYEKIVGVI